MARALVEEIRVKSVLNRVSAPTLPFRWTINPFRGCQHACVYCFARSTHEYLGMNVGPDFNQRIMVKVNAPEVLREELRRPGWRREFVALGTACDPYEPVERRYQVTRRILKVLLEAANPVGITTKGTLIKRDLDLLKELAMVARVRVNFSIGTVDQEVWKRTEPGTPNPWRRLETLQLLVESGVAAGVMMAPILPGISDSPEQLEAVVKAAAEHRAQFIAPNVLHLRPGSREWFMPFLREAYPHLLPEYQRLYKGPYAAESYTQQVLATIDHLREKWNLKEKGELLLRPAGQLALAL